MKRVISVCAFFLCSLSLFSLELIINSELNSNTFTIRDGKISYLMSFKQESDGFMFKAPPVFSYSADNTFVGEVRPAGLFKYMYSPGTEPFLYSREKPFQKVSASSTNPGFIGVGRSHEMFDYVFFMPFGLFADVKLRNVYAGILLQNKINEKTTNYMPFWQDIDYSGLSFSSVAGFNDEFGSDSFTISASALFETLYREKYGFTGRLGWNVSILFGDVMAGVHRRTENMSTQRPFDEYKMQFKKDDILIAFLCQKYSKPIYGGTNRKILYEFSIGLENDAVGFLAHHRAQSDEDTGITVESEYNLSYKEYSLDVLLDRLIENGLVLKKIKFKIDMENALFCIENAKFDLNISFSESVNFFGTQLDMNITVNHNKRYSVTSKLILK